MRGAHDPGDIAVGHGGVGADVHLGLGRLLRGGGKTRRELRQGDGLVGQIKLPILAQPDIQHRRRLLRGGGIDLGQIELETAGEQRCGDDENHQQHQHDVDHRRHIDVAHRFAFVALIKTAEAHGARNSKNGAGRQQALQIMRKPFKRTLHAARPLAQRVVGQHGGNGHGQTCCGHDEGFAHRPSHFVHADLPARCNGREGVIDAPDRTEQADERGGAAHTGQQHMARLQTPLRRLQSLAQFAGDAVFMRLPAMRGIGPRQPGGGLGHQAGQAVGVGALRRRCGLQGRRGAPIRRNTRGHTTRGPPEQGRFPQNDKPARHRHRQQHERDQMAERVTLLPELCEPSHG